MKKLASAIFALTLLAVSSTRAVTYTNSAPTNLKKEKGEVLQASATFVVSNLDLVITLSNTGTFDPKNPADILTGVFFTFVGDPDLKPVSAQVAPGSSIIGRQLPSDLDGNVGGEWAYNGDLVDAPGGGTYGISSTKLSLFKKTDLFSDEKVRGTSPLSGAQFGVTTLDDLASNNDEGGLKNKDFIQSTVVFVLDNLPSNFTTADIATDISDVTFQYGTSIKKGLDIAGDMVAQIPEPTTISLVAMGLVGALALSRSKARRR